MSQRSKAIETLSEYFEEKGGILNPVEYKGQTDTPIRQQQVKRVFGTWSRMEKIVRAFDARNKDRPEDTDAREIVAEANRLAAEHEAMIRAAGEDIEQKTAREAAARAQIEADALAAGTPEGAREVKVRMGGVESVDAKTIKESAQRALATEHAMLAATPEGAAQSKELLGGVEDQDQKNLAIARQNARTERTALLAATPEGAALAKLEMDDSDGQLTREAQVRVKRELRLYVDPATPEKVSQLVKDLADKARPDVAEAIARLDSDENMNMGAAERGDLAHDSAGVHFTETDGNLDKSPPATRESTLEENTDENMSMYDTDSTSTLKVAAENKTAKSSPKAAENKDSVNLKGNEANPEAPPADRNPDFDMLAKRDAEAAKAKAEKTTPAKK